MSQNENVAHALSGAGGGALAMVVTYPLITLSTRAQTESLRLENQKSKTKLTTLEAARAIIKREGVKGLYAGLESALFGITITNFVYYYFYEGTKALYKNKRITTAQSMTAGAIAGAATCVLTNPIWVVNTRMTVREGNQPSTIDTVREIVKKDGLKAFFAGIAPALVLVINPVLQYSIYEKLRQVVERRHRLAAVDAFILGALGKIVATSVTYPYITLKSRLQLLNGEVSMLQGIRDVLRKDGVSGLYKGLNAKILQSALTSAFLFFFKEQLFVLALEILGLIRKLRLRNK